MEANLNKLKLNKKRVVLEDEGGIFLTDINNLKTHIKLASGVTSGAS